MMVFRERARPKVPVVWVYGDLGLGMFPEHHHLGVTSYGSDVTCRVLPFTAATTTTVTTNKTMPTRMSTTRRTTTASRARRRVNTPTRRHSGHLCIHITDGNVLQYSTQQQILRRTGNLLTARTVVRTQRYECAKNVATTR